MGIASVFSKPFILVKGKFSKEKINRLLVLVGGGLVLSTAMYAACHSLYKDGKTLEKDMSFILQNKQPTTKLSVDDIRKQLSRPSLDLTERYGGDTFVLVLPNDPKLEFFLANYHNKLTDKFGYQDPGSGDEYVKGQDRQFNNFLGRSLIGFSREDWDKYVAHNYMKTTMTTANINKNAEDEGKTLVFFRPESGFDFTKTEEKSVPYETSISELNQWGFFHEMTHVRDNDIERKYADTTQLYGMSIPLDAAVLIGESIADYGSAMIMLRETGNMDIYNCLIRPMRFSLGGDGEHATSSIVDRVIGNTSYSDVKDKSDIELMGMAENRVDKLIYGDVSSFLKQSKQDSKLTFFNYILNSHKHDGAVSNYKSDRGRSAIEASIQNLVYQNKVKENIPALKEAIDHQVSQYKDVKMSEAFNKAISVGQFNTMMFSKEMGFDVDWKSFLRRDINNEKLNDYYNLVTNFRSGFDKVVIPINEKGIANIESKSINHKLEFESKRPNVSQQFTPFR